MEPTALGRGSHIPRKRGSRQMKANKEGYTMTKGIKRVTIVLMLMCLVLAVAGTGYAEVVLIYESNADAGQPVIMDAPVLQAYTNDPSVVQQTQANERNEQWYWVTFNDFEGNQLLQYSLREGEAVYAPDFIPYWNGLVFQFWFDYNQGGSPAPFLFGEGIHRNLVLVPYYLYEQDHFVSDESVIYAQEYVEDQAQQIIADILTLGSEEALGSTVVYPEALPQAAAEQLIQDILTVNPPQEQGNIAIYPVVMSDEAAQQVIAEILWDSPEAADAKVMAVEAAFVDTAVEQVIADILWVEPQTAPDAAQVGEGMSAGLADQIVLDILSEAAPEEGQVAAEPVRLTDNANQLVWEILTREHEKYDARDVEAAPDTTEAILDVLVYAPQDVATAEDTAAQPDAAQANDADQLIWEILARDTEQASVLVADTTEPAADAVTFETQVEAGSENATFTAPLTVMSDEQVNNTIADILYGSIQVTMTPAGDTPADDAAEAVLILDPEADTEDALSVEETGDAVPSDEEPLLVYAADLAAEDEDSAADALLVFEEEAPEENDGQAEQPAAEPAGDDEDGLLAYDEATDDEQARMDAPYSEAPWVEVSYSAAGDIIPGTMVTVTATVHNVDPSLNLRYQWENNAGGAYQAVPFAAGRSYTFVADDSNAQCEWRVSITAE